MLEINLENYSKLKDQKLGRAEIAALFNIPDWKMKKVIAANGWGKTPRTIGTVDAFDEYSEESCYWAGFIAADGNVDSKSRVRIMLKHDDKAHLEKFKKFLKSNHTISENTETYNRCSFEFTNKHVCDVLDLNFNIIAEKTDKLKFPKSIPSRYRGHFIRGYFDGDGSICESFSNVRSMTATIYATFACGSYEFISYLYNYINDTLGTAGHLQDFGTSRKWQIKYNTNDAKTLLNYMYQDANIFLDRKYALYTRIVKDNIRLQR